MRQIATFTPGRPPQVLARYALKALAGLGLCALTATSAILVKEMRAGNMTAMPLVSVREISFADAGLETPLPAAFDSVGAAEFAASPVVAEAAARLSEPDVREDGVTSVVIEAKAESRKPSKQADARPEIWPSGTRFFNGRPVRPIKKMKMVVTAYSPDWRSCGDSADGLTATLHSVQTNAHKLVAADPRVLPYGSMLTIPGYDNECVVPVLDCGGAIKGNRLDLLFPTHEQARKWGKKTVTVTVWGYADGKPAPNPRKARDGKAH